jgi:alpha-glucosidase
VYHKGTFQKLDGVIMTVNTTPWWQQGIIYQIYPRSFKDSNRDGIGDLGGIISELEYLNWLGVGAIWISPFYPSPMVDFGYDVSNYTDVDPIFGDMATFDELVQQAHQQGSGKNKGFSHAQFQLDR